MTKDITVNNFFKVIYDIGAHYIDFQTNLHRVYASQQMGFLNATSYHSENNLKDFEDSLIQNYNFSREKIK